jgi:hypothetical protein
MKSAVFQIIMALDKTERIRATSISYNGENILFHLDGGEPKETDPASPSTEIEKWLTANDPDQTPGKGYSPS